MEIVDDGSVTSPAGFLAGAVASGLKKPDASGAKPLDLALVYSERDCTAAGAFTRNQVVAAPVSLDKATLAGNREAVRAVVANAGNANACTGLAGEAAARGMQQSAAFALGVRPEQVLVLSTGVIGLPLPMPQVNAGIDAAARRLRSTAGGAAAAAIMTTDTFPKQVAIRVATEKGEYTIGGIAKGAGMIHPDMATMLAVLTTDAELPAELLQQVLQRAVEASFNRISVDGDTSTNDTVLLLANGASMIRIASNGSREGEGQADDESHERARVASSEVAGSERLAPFEEALTVVCTTLAKMIVRDGEGASKFVEIVVQGMADEADAVRVAKTIATSPLVKTALAGSDANWGRILAAAGRAGVPFAQEESALWVGNPRHEALQLVSGGTPTGYAEEEAAAIFAAPEIEIRLQLGTGPGSATVWTCDLTGDYVTINASYRT